MKTTRKEARRILRRYYPNERGVVITSRPRMMVVSRAEEAVTPSLVWRAEYRPSPVAQADDVVFIGRLLNAGQPGPLNIDWSWEP